MELPTRRDVLAAAREAQRPIAAVLPVHYPRALLRACGFQPLEVWGPSGDGITSPHFQDYACGLVHHAASFLLGDGAGVDVVLVPHTCDAMQGMASVLRDFVRPRAPVLTLYQPRERREADLAYLVAELHRLAEELSAVSGQRPSDGELMAAIRTEEEAASAFASLLSSRGQLALRDREFYALLRAREYLPAEDFTALATRAPRGASPASGVKLMLSGILPEPMELFDALNGMGSQVVADDLACVSRRLYPVVEEADPWLRLARTLLGAPPEPTRGSPIPERLSWVKEKLTASGARGLLVWSVKFCEPELFYLPALCQGLEAAGLPVLHVEHDLSGALPSQALTRIEAFVEMLR